MRLTTWLQRVCFRTSSTRLRRARVGKRCERLEARLVLAAPHPFELSTLNGDNGVRLNGIDAADGERNKVSHLGDVNGDGFGDWIIGASDSYGAGNAKRDAGKSDVVFCKLGWSVSSTLELDTLRRPAGLNLPTLRHSMA